MTGECGRCGQDKTLKARGLCSNCRNRCTADGTLGQYGWVRVNRLAEFSELRERHYPVEVAGARVGVSARTAWRYEAARPHQPFTPTTKDHPQADQNGGVFQHKLGSGALYTRRCSRSIRSTTSGTFAGALASRRTASTRKRSWPR